MPIPVRVDTHVADGLGLLIDAFKSRKVIDGVLAAWLKQFQDLERVFWEILQGRGVEDAVGVQLDFLGQVVGEDRLGRSDDELRSAIKLKIRTNRSQGRAEDVLQTAALILTTGQWEYAEYNNAAFRVLYWGLPSYLFSPLVRAIRLTRPAGVRGYIMFAPSPLNEILFWTHTDGITPARHGAYTHTTGLPRRVMVHVETV
jgi:hypothetical protein